MVLLSTQNMFKLMDKKILPILHPIFYCLYLWYVYVYFSIKNDGDVHSEFLVYEPCCGK